MLYAFLRAGKLYGFPNLRPLSIFQELHAHLGGSISDETLEELITSKGDKIDYLNKFNQSKGKLRTMEECFAVFAILPKLVDNLDTLYHVTCSVLNDFKNDNIIYLELRTEPKSFPACGSSMSDYVKTILKGFHDCNVVKPEPSLNTTLFARLILSISRAMTHEEAMNVVDLCNQFRNTELGKDVIVGVDLGGNPCKGCIDDFLPALNKAKSLGFPLALHVAEIPGQNKELLPLLSIPPDRIGHGTFLHPEAGGLQEAVDIVRKYNIPIEVCLTSNLKCQTVHKYGDHHLNYWRKKAHKIIICTDDKGIFGSNLSEELFIASEEFNLSREDIINLTISAMDSAFCCQSIKDIIKTILCNWKES